MRLGEFIRRDMEAILARWEAFAATRRPAANHMASLELRDHAQQILEAVVIDLATAQTVEQQSAKSMGLALMAMDAPETAAQTHAVLRAKSGFNVEQLVSEYRALRSSVLSLWMEACFPSLRCSTTSFVSTRRSTRRSPSPSRSSARTSRARATCCSAC